MYHNNILNFLGQSKTFEGITMSGCYTMPLVNIELLYEHFKDTGDNLLDRYSALVYVLWYNEEDLERTIVSNYSDLLSDARMFKQMAVIRQEQYEEIYDKVARLKETYRLYKLRKDGEPRREAQAFISKPTVRREVFELHGKKCLKCGTKKNISLDHIVPVSKGGENHIDNLQPLCMTCNVKKGTKIIDYRNV